MTVFSSPFELNVRLDNPLDLLEEIAGEKGWDSRRFGECDLEIAIKGEQAEYKTAFNWQEEFTAVQICATLDLSVSQQLLAAASDMLMRTNERLWLGHFDISPQGATPCFRYTAIFRDTPDVVVADILENLLEIARAECDRFFQSFRLLCDGDVRAQETLSAAILETIGEA